MLKNYALMFIIIISFTSVCDGANRGRNRNLCPYFDLTPYPSVQIETPQPPKLTYTLRASTCIGCKTGEEIEIRREVESSKQNNTTVDLTPTIPNQDYAQTSSNCANGSCSNGSGRQGFFGRLFGR